MANFTKEAIVETFIEMLNERPLDKITVRELTERCGVSRNTFYYHFHDVYDLVDALFRAEEARLLSDVTDLTSLREGFADATRFALDNWTAIRHIYDSANRDQLSAYLFNASQICIRPFVQAQREGLSVSDGELESIIFLYSSMLQGVVMNILRTGVPRNAEELVDSSCRLLEGSVRFALENAAA